MIKTIQLLFILLFPISWAVQAGSYESHAAIHTAISDFLASKNRQSPVDTEIEVQSIDRRLRLAKCDNPLKISLLPGNRPIGRISVGVRCEGSKQPWSIYASAYIKSFTDVVVLNESLPRNSEVSSADLILKRMEISTLRSGYLTNLKDAVGKKLKRSLQKGTTLNQRFLITQKMVKKGSQIIILAKNHQLAIRVSGKALSSGAKGDLIRVQNIKSKRIIQAKVISEGVVQIPL
jgi:flagella basal body P-ring formation protein FlgA